MSKKTVDSTYASFITGKQISHKPSGIKNPKISNAKLFPFQRDIVAWALRHGTASIFAGTGLGKSGMQCEWARSVERHTKRPVLVFAPLAVAAQTIREAEKLCEMEVKFAASDSDVGARGVYVTNYQKLHHFDIGRFAGVALDESSIIKCQDGAFRNKIIESCQTTPFRLACTATPAPNDFMEIGNHSEFMGALSMSEMLSTFFVHDGGETQSWRLKGHAESDFWKWMASWSVCVRMPSDLGYSDDGYILPPLHVHEHIVGSTPNDGEFFATHASTLQERRSARKNSLSDRVALAARLANESREQWALWCNLNGESEALAKSIDGAVEVTGSDSDEHKEKAMLDFAAGKIRVLVSKPSICGFGMNFQSCHNTSFVGLSDSFEQYYQAIRRFYRFGQKNEVHAHIIISEAEGAVLKNIQRKEHDSMMMQSALIEHMADISKRDINGASPRTGRAYSPEMAMQVPAWLKN